MHQIELLNYYEIGHGYPVVLLHGGNVDAFSWFFQIPLAYRYRLILPDLRGRGGSPKSPKGCSIALLASDVNELLEKLDIKKAVICGVSFGGAVALQFALDHGAKVKALALSDTMSRLPQTVPTEEQPSIRDFILSMMSWYRGGPEGLQKLKEHLMSIITGSDFANTSVGRMMMDAMMERISDLDPDSLYENMEGLLGFDVHDRLSEINVPTLIIAAKEDQVIQAQESKELHERIKNSEYVEIEGGHATMILKSDHWNRTLKAFLKKVTV